MSRPAILNEDVVVVPREPVAWRYRDFAGGWILDHSVRSAEGYCSATGAEIQPLYASPHADAWAEVRAYVGELEARCETWQRNSRDTFDAMVTMRNDINGHIPMPSLESDLAQGPETSVFCAAVAGAVVAHTSAAEVRISELEARLKEAELVIGPFAERAGKLDGIWENHETQWSPEYGNTKITIGHLRAARAFMEGSK